ncbi:LIN28 [Mytilus edulis]|uniref:LIN28 n=1 Tax=Mytilus edulis TaxID=6550 RepID=A0A8S3SEV0_MYTED|nr:LIN28 [Mytilus edulis]
MGASCSSDQTSGSSGGIGDVPKLKIAVVGDRQVGKSCVVSRYMKNQFSPMYIPTKKPVIESSVRKINIPGHAVVALTVWDIPGQEDIDLYSTYFKNLDAAVVIVDINDSESIEMAPVWKRIVVNNTFETSPVVESSEGGKIETTTMEKKPVDPETFPVLLLGNKFDLVEEDGYKEKLRQMKASEKDESGAKTIWNITEEDKPECVRLMDKIKQKANFYGSVTASARDSDGTVAEGIQFLLRHVLQTKYGLNKWKPKETKKVKAKNKIEEYDGLDMTEIEIFDSIFKVAEISVKKVKMLTDYHNKCLGKLRESCTNAGILGEDDAASLEDCMIALRRNVGEQAKLKVKKDDDFCKLDVTSKDPDFKPERYIRILLKIYQNEFAVVCKAILKECPAMISKLKDQDAELSTLCESSWEEVELSNGIPRPKDEVNKISDIIVQNRARMQHTKLESAKLIDKVEDYKKKIKAEFLW